MKEFDVGKAVAPLFCYQSQTAVSLVNNTNITRAV